MNGSRASLIVLATMAFIAPMMAGAQARIQGTVVDSLRGHAPLSGAVVVLLEQNRYTTADARGRFHFDSVPSGRATLGLLHPVLDSLDLQLPPTSVDVNARNVRVVMSIPPAERLYTLLCSGAREDDGGVVVGRVRDIDSDVPLEGAVVATEWVEYVVTGGRSTPKVMAVADRSRAGGLFVLCNVPTQVPLLVRARYEGVLAGPARLSLDDRLLGRADVALSRRDTAARHVSVADTVTPGDDVYGTAAMRGRITRADGTPAARALVGVVGTGRLTRADDNGMYQLDGIAAGTRTIDVRAIGSAPRQESFDFRTGGVRTQNFTLDPAPQALAAVKTVETRRMGINASGFAERRRVGLGAFLTQEDIKRHSALDLNAALMTMRGIRIDGGLFMGMPLMRNVELGGHCIPAFFLDGLQFPVDGPRPANGVLYPYTDLTGAAPVEQILGIEVYASLGGIPPQYDVPSARGCGAIVIWTR